MRDFKAEANNTTETWNNDVDTKMIEREILRISFVRMKVDSAQPESWTMIQFGFLAVEIMCFITRQLH